MKKVKIVGEINSEKVQETKPKFDWEKYLRNKFQNETFSTYEIVKQEDEGNVYKFTILFDNGQFAKKVFISKKEYDI